MKIRPLVAWVRVCVCVCLFRERCFGDRSLPLRQVMPFRRKPPVNRFTQPRHMHKERRAKSRKDKQPVEAKPNGCGPKKLVHNGTLVWKHGPKPAQPLLLNLEPHPNGNGCGSKI